MRMHYHVNFFVRHIKKPMSFDNFQALISQGGRIYSNLLAHTPIGVVQALSEGNTFQLATLFTTEGATASSNEKAFYFVLFTALQRLEDCAVLAIHRGKAYVIFSNSFHNQATCCYQGFFIGKSNILTAVNSSHSRTQASITNHGSKDCIYFAIGCRSQETFFTGKNFSFAVVTCFKTSSCFLIGKYCKIWLKGADLFF